MEEFVAVAVERDDAGADAVVAVVEEFVAVAAERDDAGADAVVAVGDKAAVIAVDDTVSDIPDNGVEVVGAPNSEYTDLK